MIEDVELAQTGDHRAFARLVRRASPMVLGYARAWLKDEGLAEDAAQDAFADAFLRLEQLKDPAAFFGWMRRIAHKHCDRRTRRKTVEPEGEPAPASTAQAAPPAWLEAIDRLPEHERIVFALHYLGDEPQKDVANFLELPLSTVKKRLHTARGRLRSEQWRLDVNTTPKTERLEDRISLFVAIRSGDVDAAHAVLTRRPALLEAPEQWTTAEALDGRLPLAHRLTPLILASKRGDRAMVELLLKLGADPNGACGCDAGEQALFAAALAGRHEIVKILVDAGANANAENKAGFTAHDIEQLRQPDTFAGWKKVGRRLHTGIKAVDMFTPLEEGMLVRVHGAAETGLTVLLAELTARIGHAGWHSVWTAGTSGKWQGAELAQAAADLGVADAVTVATGGAVEELRARSEPCALFVFLGDAPEAEVEASLPVFRDAAAITFVVAPWADVTAGRRSSIALARPWDAQICTSPKLAAEGIYPALDPSSSDSTAAVDERHESVRDAARAAFANTEVRGFLAQPFGVAEHLTGSPGVAIPLDVTLDGFAERTRSYTLGQ